MGLLWVCYGLGDAVLLGKMEKALHLLDAAYFLYPEKRPQQVNVGVP